MWSLDLSYLDVFSQFVDFYRIFLCERAHSFLGQHPRQGQKTESLVRGAMSTLIFLFK
jgi:hypothetical protein